MFKLSESTNAKVTALYEAMNKLDEANDLIGEALGDDDSVMEMLCNLHGMITELTYMCDDLCSEELENE